MNRNLGFILRKSGDPPLYWKATGPTMKQGRFIKERSKAALFTTRRNAELFAKLLELPAEVVPA